MTGKRLLIVAHAPSPNTERLRDALIAGARSPEIEGVEVTALGPFATTPAVRPGARPDSAAAILACQKC